MALIENWMILDGQFGSTGKGLIAGYIALRRNPDAVVNNFGPNAGHTVVLNDRRVIMTQMLPTAIIAPSVRRIFIGPGAIINPEIFMHEVSMFAEFLKGKKILVHPRTTIVLPRHREQEANSLKRISSTQKGTGAAMCSKIMREIDVVAENLSETHPMKQYVVTQSDYEEHMDRVNFLQIESAQGFDLGLNQGYAYPYCTSRDITPFQIAADCGIPFSMPIHEIIVTLRTFPIRVGHQYDENGIKIGDSGPVYPDQEELKWDQIKFAPQPERTTVTNKIRRIFTFSEIALARMIKHCTPSGIFLNFANYLDHVDDFDDYRHNRGNILPVEGYGNLPKYTQELVDKIEKVADRGGLVKWIGVGPKVEDVLERVR